MKVAQFLGRSQAIDIEEIQAIPSFQLSEVAGGADKIGFVTFKLEEIYITSVPAQAK